MPSSNNVRKVTSENYPTDAGREGELIFRLVYQQAGCKKPFSRLWLSSMEENAIREGFAHLKPSTEYDALYNAALCRERADWMVGINASRLFSCLYNQPLAVGRVMTPVLAMTVVREAAIAAFTPEKFYTVDLELTSGCTASSRRIPEKTVAENLLEACRKEMVATIQRITRKEKSENPPPLYDLTTLQRDANRLLGYSAQQTLDYVQSLYEKKLTTYPRTDSCYITDDDEEMLEELTEELEGFLDITPEDVDEAVPRTRRTVNREKVTDHHAILPTRSMLQADLDALPKGEQNVLKLIIARTLMAVSKPFRYLETLLTTECAGEEFTAKGKEILEEGWKAVERKVLADILNRKQELTALPNAAENECGILNAELKEGQTSPPKHFTEDTLLHAMETASADSMPEGVERQGIGTPATRAATIEKLVQKGFLERKGNKKAKVLLPTDKGKALITVMPEEIQSADMTADWEAKLLQIERGEMEPSEFMTEMEHNLQLKNELCEAAEALQMSEEWKKTTDELIALQARWKEIGAVSRRYSDQVWKRFRAACDKFFERKAAHFSDVDGQYEQNLVRKQALLDEMAAADVKEGGFEMIKEFQRRWSEIGFVPIKRKDEIQKRYKECVDTLFSVLRGSERDRSMSRFREKVSAFKASGDRRIRTERDRLYNRVKQLESDIALLENNIGFFAHSKGAEALIADVREKIERAKREMADTIEKVKLIDREAARESEDREA